MNNKQTVTVCDKCLKASCWQGIFMCDDSAFADITEKSVGELEELNLEHQRYWVEL
jgi:epoxyqueuosine reductase QueG